MSSLDDVYIEKRLSSVANTQESIQSLSLWALHHKAQHKQIVNIWLQLLNSATLDLRLNLFYLCNEMVQTCKKRNADLFKDSFKRVLREAVVFVRDSPVRSNIERIFRIWIERNVFEADYVEELMTLLYDQQPKSTAAKLLAEFKPEKLLDLIKSSTRVSQEVEMKKKSLELLPFSVNEIESFPLRLKNHDSCEEKYSDSLERTRRCLNEYIFSLDSEVTQRKLMLQMLELSEGYYDDQYSDASVVAQAYKNFGNRISNLKLKLMEYQKLIPDPRSRSPSATNARVSADSLPAAESFNVKKTSDVLTSSKNDCMSSNGLETILPKLEKGFMTFLPKRIPSLGSQYAADVVVEATPAAVAEGDSTPVQDEEPDEPLPFDNPMEFLSQLINRSASRLPLSTAVNLPPVADELKDQNSQWAEWQVEGKTVGHGFSHHQDPSSFLEVSHQQMPADSNFSITVEGPVVSISSAEADVDISADVHSGLPDESVLHATENFTLPGVEHSQISGNLESIHQAHLPSYSHHLCPNNAEFSFSSGVFSTLPHSSSTEVYKGNTYDNNKTYFALSARNCLHGLEDDCMDLQIPLPLEAGSTSHEHAVNQCHRLRPSHPYLVNSSSCRLPLQQPFHRNEFHSTRKTFPRQQLPQLQPLNVPQAQQERFQFEGLQCCVSPLESVNYGSTALLHCQDPSSLAFRFGSVSPSSCPVTSHLDSADTAFWPHFSFNQTWKLGENQDQMFSSVVAHMGQLPNDPEQQPNRTHNCKMGIQCSSQVIG